MSTPPPPGPYDFDPSQPSDGYGAPQPPYSPYPPHGYPYAPPPTSALATWALVTGILGLACCGVFGIVGILLGVLAKKEIAASQGGLGGEGLAMTGIILGIISAVLSVLAVVGYAVLVMLAES
ncbi:MULTISPECIES: DUF4190 domain-containing protein [Mumia]|uniref:DUF4190 domain-containing protein n=1 Tax=Mumia xiangluensis TaxID=1678900 RepID=A0ABW1QNJ7_9ACTN|nr:MULTISPECIES: DUF4190 domain-containing protein [Mumia]